MFTSPVKLTADEHSIEIEQEVQQRGNKVSDAINAVEYALMP